MRRRENGALPNRQARRTKTEHAFSILHLHKLMQLLRSGIVLVLKIDTMKGVCCEKAPQKNPCSTPFTNDVTITPDSQAIGLWK
jgi:hypothetical protein